VWAILGTTLSNLAPASRLDILLLDAIDVVLDHDHDGAAVVGFRLADGVRGAYRVCHEFPLTLVLDRRLVLALGLAFLDGRRGVPDEEEPTVLGWCRDCVLRALAHLPRIPLRSALIALGYHYVRPGNGIAVTCE